MNAGTFSTSCTTTHAMKVLLVLTTAVVLGYVVWRTMIARPKAPDTVVEVSGRIEGDDSNISAPKTSGRILEVRFREGDTVKTGDTIAVLDDAQVRAREEQARAALAASEARERSARAQLAAIQEQLQQSQLQTAQSKWMPKAVFVRQKRTFRALKRNWPSRKRL